MLFTDEVKKEILLKLEAEYNKTMADYDEADTAGEDGSVAWQLKAYPQHKNLIHAVDLNYLTANLNRVFAQIQKAKLKKALETLYSENPSEEEIKSAKYQLLAIEIDNEYIATPSIDTELADWYYNLDHDRDDDDQKYVDYVQAIMNLLSKNIHDKPQLDEILCLEDDLDFEGKEDKPC